MVQGAYDPEDSIDSWTLTPEDHVRIAGKSRANRLAFARRGELAINRTEDHELSMLSLHLLPNCMDYINTLMIQQRLSRPHWAERLTTTDLRALTPLIWEHVNPYGRFELNMETRLDLSPIGPCCHAG